MAKQQIIIYGAGKVGKMIYSLISACGQSELVYGFCDRNYQELKSVEGKKVFSYEEVRDKRMPFIVGVGNALKDEVIRMLGDDKQTIIYCDFGSLANLLDVDLPTLEREYCAQFHVSAMDGYFESAESEASLKVFWGETSPFFQMFQKLDLSHVIELACGRGRHVPKYIDQAGDITLVDILQKNIDFCKQRFFDRENIFYYCNNGYNLEKLESGRYSALFSYDAMVHFELIDIFSYLKDIHRVLKEGGFALLHHSNYDSDYKAAFRNAPSGRSFMNQKVFAYLAYRAGLEVVEQRVIDWDGREHLDCVTLLQKST